MNKVRSINQNNPPDTLPNFRNLGVTLRIILVSNGLALLQALLQADGWTDVPQHMMLIATLLTPTLLVVLLLLWAAQPWLHRLAYHRGVLVVSAMTTMATLFMYYLGRHLYNPLDGDDLYFNTMRYMLLSILLSGILLMYFRLRSQMLSLALHDARLQVLRARIRPHFMFNSINVVLGIMRAHPAQAETALHDMADMFRTAMGDAEDLVKLHHEIELSKQYLSLEQLRLGERLSVDWQIQGELGEALIPPLLLQPLLENAVYHGIESLPQGGSISVSLSRNGDELRLRVENPCAPRGAAKHSGSKMALQNIRERLALLFDVEARYQVESGLDYYRVEIALPYKE